MKKLATICTLFLALQVSAQDVIFTLDYNLGFGQGDFKEFIADDAYRGGGLNYTKFLESNEHIGIGLSLDWHGFYEKTDRSTFAYYEDGSKTSTADINAVQFRYLYTTPILLGLDYYLVKDASILPYVGINAGIGYTEQELYISAFDNDVNTSWDFVFGPEAGMHVVFGESGFGFNVIAKYNYSTYSHTIENIQFETKQSSFLSVGIGLSFMMVNYY